MAASEPFILFRDDTTGEVMLFAGPASMIIARTKAEFLPALKRMEEARQAGKWLAGYIAYEAGHLFEEKLAPFAEDNRKTPLLCSASSMLLSRTVILSQGRGSGTKTRNS